MKTKSRKVILLVEDDRISYLLISEILQSFKFIIHHVTNGKEAVEFFKMNPDINLILMDIKLPLMDGYEATAEIRRINPNIPIIAQTAFALSGDREKAIRYGCTDHITKPIDSKKLYELIKFYLSD